MCILLAALGAAFVDLSFLIGAIAMCFRLIFVVIENYRYACERPQITVSHTAAQAGHDLRAMRHQNR